MELDRLDRRLLSHLQQDGRLTNVELSERIGLSASPCLRRLKRLEENQTIQGYHAALDRQQIGLTMTIFVEVSLDNHRDEYSSVFEQHMQTMDHVISCHLVSGMADYLLEVVARDLQDYEKVLKQLQTLPMVKDIRSNFAIRSVKNTAALPIDTD